MRSGGISLFDKVFFYIIKVLLLSYILGCYIINSYRTTAVSSTAEAGSVHLCTPGAHGWGFPDRAMTCLRKNLLCLCLMTLNGFYVGLLGYRDSKEHTILRGINERFNEIIYTHIYTFLTERTIVSGFLGRRLAPAASVGRLYTRTALQQCPGLDFMSLYRFQLINANCINSR